MSINALSAPPGLLRLGQPMPQSSSTKPLSPGSKSSPWRNGPSPVFASNGGFINPKVIDSQLGVACPALTAVSVRTDDGEVPIHANVIKFDRRCIRPGHGSATPTDASEHCAKAGQSPQRFELCARFLVEGLDSGQGLFQFVSRKAHAASIVPTKATTQERSIIDQLLDEWRKCGKEPGKLSFAGRYEVTQVEEEPTQQAYYRRVMLTVTDMNDGKTITVPLTQAGLKFTDRLLRWPEIKTANTLLEGHRECVEHHVPNATLPTADPMIISLAGIGRNAALITYRETQARINAEPPTTRLNEQWLDETLKNIVESGRRDRGPGFMHSDAQLQALRAGFKEVLEERNLSISSAQLQAQSQRQSARAHRLVPHQNPSEAPRQRAISDPTMGPAAPVAPAAPAAPAAPMPRARAQGTRSHLANNPLQTHQPQSLIPTQQPAPIQQQVAIDKQQLEEERRISNEKQLNLVLNCGYQRELKDQSEEFVLFASASALSDHVLKTYNKQEISGSNNRCWFFSSWLPVFAMMSPEQLETKLPTICDLDKKVKVNADALILGAIARLYQENPAAFMLAKSASDPTSPGSVDAAVRQTPARLGPDLPLTDLVKIQPQSGRLLEQMRGKTPESFLQQLQCNVATAFLRTGMKETDFGFMEEIENLQKSKPQPATPRFALTLHRALGLPVLVIETKESDTATLWVSAPKGSELATTAQQLAEQPIGETKAWRKLLAQFSKLPVIWLNTGHFSVYFPKCLPAETQQALRQAVQPAGMAS